jgi:intein/homing endonuclease
VVKVVKGPESKPLYQVGVGQNKLKVTEDHPFLTQRGWVRADQLRQGEWLLGEEVPRKVSSIKRVSSRTPITVYNFELSTDVDEGHLVLANGIPTGELAIQVKLKGTPPPKIP